MVPSEGNTSRRVLILGGTTEARRLATLLATRPEIDAVVSLAGRTASPLPLPLRVRRGGFGGAAGLVRHLSREGIGALVDATHPYAVTISRSAAAASLATGVPLLALRRPAWTPEPGDRWLYAADAADAVSLLGPLPRRVFLALGRNEVRAFEVAPQHDYLVRSVDPLEPPLAVPRAIYRLGLGPFDVQAEHALLVRYRIEVIVAKNSGNSATHGKIAAARALGLEVVMLRRPELPEVPQVVAPEEVLPWLDHVLALRGV